MVCWGLQLTSGAVFFAIDMGLTHHAPAMISLACMHAAMTSITRALMAVNGGDEASVRPITDALNANGFNCDADMASDAFLEVAEGDLVALCLNIKQKATVRAAQVAARRTQGELPRARSLPCIQLNQLHCVIIDLCCVLYTGSGVCSYIISHIGICHVICDTCCSVLLFHRAIAWGGCTPCCFG